MTTSHDKNVLWDSIETKYWDSIKAARDQEDAVIQQDLIANQQQIKSALANLYQRRTQLSLEIKGANDLIFEHEQKLDSLNAEYDKRRRQIEQQRASDDDGQRAFFAQHREGSSAPPGGHPQDEANRLIAARREGIDPITGARIEQNAQSRAANGTLGPQELPLRTGFVPANGSVPPNAPSTGVHIVDADGQIYAEVPRIGIQNRYIETIASMRVRQPVRMRSGKKFTEEQFQSIFEPADQKGSKWVAVMVQAKGEIQKHPCHYCWKKAGVFEECILIGGEDFPRCGNCEWSRQSCQGAGLNGQSVESADQPQSQAGFAVAGFTAANQAPPNMNGHQPTGFTPLNASQAPTPGESFSQFPTGTSSNSGTPQPDVKKRGNKEPVEDEEEESLPEITGATLDLRDNGEVFTEPACMAAVPLRKIHKGHPYWEPDWQPVEDLIAPQLAKWTEKLDQIKSNQNTTNAYRFQANRQVNRGNTILRYFETAEFSPFQLMGKKVMSHGIMTYDTLFRLVATLEELKKFSTVDVTPLQWVRQRLIEIYNADPANFNLCKTVHDFYHDKKLVQLRKRNGFGNIGRPSGHKMSKDRDSSEKPAGPGRGRRGRKSMQQANADGIESTPRQYKRQRTDKNVSPATGGAVVDNTFNPDLDYDGYTSTDSYSGDTMKKGDWRLYQVKTHKYISDVNITQYWHWIDGAFQHQVLQSTNPISWGLYEEPINFNVRLTDIDDIMYSPECTKIIITRKADGNGLDTPDVLVHFKRERTKRRFLQFADKKGIKLVKTNRLFVENCWSSSHMDAEELQGDSPSDDAASTPAE